MGKGSKIKFIELNLWRCTFQSSIYPNYLFISCTNIKTFLCILLILFDTITLPLIDTTVKTVSEFLMIKKIVYYLHHSGTLAHTFTRASAHTCILCLLELENKQLRKDWVEQFTTIRPRML